MLRERLARALTGAALILPAPVVVGDWPDPSVIRAENNEYVAVTTAGDWAPMFRVLRSTDLKTWRLAGAVFYNRPRWAKEDFWAPEIVKLRSGYAVFYSALPRRKKSWLCLGVATARTVDGPWVDAGRPLRCGKYGSIDPFVTRDETGRLFLLWKEDGNEFKRPTPMFAQQLREDGKRLLGRRVELFRNSRRWEGKVVEAAHVLRTNGWFYMTYSANLCCTRRCRYAIGVARARRLIGPWQKFNGNPILRSGRSWRCPGHATIVQDPEGGMTALFHAYRGGSGRLAGRQLLAAPFTIASDGWPRIGGPTPPEPSPGAARIGFTDDFRSSTLDPEWEWPLIRSPGIASGDGLLLGAGRGSGRRLDGGVLVRRVGTERYTATAVLDRAGLVGRSQGGIASYRSRFEAIGVSVGRVRAVVWQRRFGRYRRLNSAAVPGSAQLTLRMVARGNNFRFEVSRDGTTWQAIGNRRGPIEESSRFALTSGGARGASARFLSASVIEE